MLGQRLVTDATAPNGLPVERLYVVQKLDIAQEFYFAIAIDRSLGCPIIIMSKGSANNHKELEAKDSDSFVKVPLKYSQGVTDEAVTTIVAKLGLGQLAKVNISKVLQALYAFFKSHDVTFVELSQLVVEARTGQYLSASSRLSIDNAAARRQEQLFFLRDSAQERKIEIEAEKHGLVFVQLDGNIGCLVNGAGLAMATNDAVAYYGGKCANFLDGGGQATKETMIKAFELILSDRNVNTILVNIYGGTSLQIPSPPLTETSQVDSLLQGIIRCDMIAKAIIEAAQTLKNIPVVVRLQGTNSSEGQTLVGKH